MLFVSAFVILSSAAFAQTSPVDSFINCYDKAKIANAALEKQVKSQIEYFKSDYQKTVARMNDRWDIRNWVSRMLSIEPNSEEKTAALETLEARKNPPKLAYARALWAKRNEQTLLDQLSRIQVMPLLDRANAAFVPIFSTGFDLKNKADRDRLAPLIGELVEAAQALDSKEKELTMFFQFSGSHISRPQLCTHETIGIAYGLQAALEQNSK